MTIRILSATVWLVFGIGLKLLGFEPRHQMIVANILGDEIAVPATILIGIMEGCLGLWILTGIRPLTCAAVQTLAIASMNALELTRARDLLLAPVFMVCANVVFLTLVWYSAWHSPVRAVRGVDH